MKGIISLIVLYCFVNTLANPLPRQRRATQHEYKMCVPDHLLDDCKQMVQTETKSTLKITCVAARDRDDCLDKIHDKLADFGEFEPEDMYLAQQDHDDHLNLFQEIRTKEEPEAEFRYEAVAVIHKDLDIKDVEGLKGLKSCHTGVGRNVGYKIPLTKLKKMGIIGGLNETELTPRENELKAFSTLFSKACIVGKWSADPEIHKKLKKKYSNLCELCEHPDICDYPDKFSGYDGALRCLAHNGGQVAWTKVYYVKKFFGMPIGTLPAVPTEEKPEDFAYFCPDGTKVPITETPCRWAARPWPGFMVNTDVIKSIDELRTKITNLNAAGEKAHAKWLETVLSVGEKNVIKDTKLISPKDYLDKSNYTDVIEREYGPPVRVVRICTTSDVENEKCKKMSRVAFSRDLRPRFECVQQSGDHDCIKAIRDNVADVVSLNAAFIETYKESFNLKPILTEEHEPSKGKYYSVAVVKKNSAIRNMEDLKGKKACMGEYNSFIGYRAPIYMLIKAGSLKKSSCPYNKALTELFTGGICAPGAKLPEYEVDAKVAEKMCSICAGNLDSNDSNPAESKCQSNIKEAFHGNGGAFRCLASGQGDVAFVRHTTVAENTDGHNKIKWAKNLKSEDFELLCPKGGRAAIDKYEDCNVAKVPRNMVVTNNGKSPSDIDEIRHLLVSASQFFNKRPEVFKLFGSYENKQDLIFQDSTTGLVSYNEEIQQEFKKILTETTC